MHRKFKIKIKLLALAAAGFAFSLPAFADSVNFAASTGNMGKSHVFTINGGNITATGYSTTGVTGNLYFKNNGGDETGLGLAGMPANEISGTGFVQFGFGSFLAGANAATQLHLGSVESGESYNVYGSNTAGVQGTLLGTGNSAHTTFTLPTTQPYQFVSVSAAKGNVLVQGIQAATSAVSVPEPGVFVLLLSGMLAMIGAAALLRR